MASVNYEIQNEHITAVIRRTGAELASLKDRRSGRELIWQADPAIWASSAPVLFPIVGRLKNDAYEHNGQQYRMAGHGVVRERDFDLTDSDAQSISLQINADAQTREHWPFEFSLILRFRLSGSRLLIEHTVRNTGTETMPFAVGAHPAFSIIGPQKAFDPKQISEYLIEFDRPETLDLYRLDGTVIGKKVFSDYLNQDKQVELSPDIFDHDALIFKNIQSQTIGLRHRERGTIVRVETGGAPHLGIWAKPKAPYVCIEPWHGYSDSIDASGHLSDKPSMKLLDAGYSFDWTYGICI